MNEDSSKARGTIAVCIAILLMGAMLGSFLLNPSERQQSNLNLIIGGLLTSLSTIIGWYFGSSQSSKNKDELLAGVVRAGTGTGGSAMTNATPTGTAEDPVATVDVAAPDTGKPPRTVGTGVDLEIPFPRTPEDPRLGNFRRQMRLVNQQATEEQVLAAFRVMFPGA